MFCSVLWSGNKDGGEEWSERNWLFLWAPTLPKVRPSQWHGGPELQWRACSSLISVSVQAGSSSSSGGGTSLRRENCFLLDKDLFPWPWIRAEPREVARIWRAQELRRSLLLQGCSMSGLDDTPARAPTELAKDAGA